MTAALTDKERIVLSALAKHYSGIRAIEHVAKLGITCMDWMIVTDALTARGLIGPSRCITRAGLSQLKQEQDK